MCETHLGHTPAAWDTKDSDIQRNNLYLCGHRNHLLIWAEKSARFSIVIQSYMEAPWELPHTSGRLARDLIVAWCGKLHLTGGVDLSPRISGPPLENLPVLLDTPIPVTGLITPPTEWLGIKPVNYFRVLPLTSWILDWRDERHRRALEHIVGYGGREEVGSEGWQRDADLDCVPTCVGLDFSPPNLARRVGARWWACVVGGEEWDGLSRVAMWDRKAVLLGIGKDWHCQRQTVVWTSGSQYALVIVIGALLDYFLVGRAEQADKWKRRLCAPTNAGVLNKKQQVKRKDHALPRGRELGVNTERSARRFGNVRFQGEADVRTGKQERRTVRKKDVRAGEKEHGMDHGAVSERNVRFQGKNNVHPREKEHETVSECNVRLQGKNDVHPGEQEHETGKNDVRTGEQDHGAVSEQNVYFQGKTSIPTGEQEYGTVRKKDVRSREKEHGAVSELNVHFQGKTDVRTGEHEYGAVSERNVRV
ncbi:hypothetical protein DFP72DRAFT_855174 [Ephemerocybe angulata]|uniref:Uncharacterized protein n=1 Tax=Ephemerocybe angulata TaxID=980116 RepID=A0A8H6HGJ6_9AGAR|nr:hypothetical protein DFP72DRAFT_855174 [Tulosesus angulatus]